MLSINMKSAQALQSKLCGLGGFLSLISV